MRNLTNHKAIAVAVLDALLDAGYLVSLCEPAWAGGETWLPRTNDRATLLDHLDAADTVNLKAWERYTTDEGAKRVRVIGEVALNFMNDAYEMVDDYTSNLDDVLAKPLALSRTFVV